MASKKDSPGSDKRAVIYFLSGNSSQEAVKLRRDATIFGREKGDIMVGDKEMSSTHCQIQNIDGQYHIFDMNSTNGTFVNNERVIKARLKHNDVITVGQTSFKFSLEEEGKVRHISTILKSSHKNLNDSKNSLVDTLIESELRNTQSYSIVLQVTYLDGKSEEIELQQRVIYIGRASSFGRFDQDVEASRKHLMVKLNDTGEIFIEDQGSTNGSFLNGKRINGMNLVRPKDSVKVGTSTMKIFARKN